MDTLTKNTRGQWLRASEKADEIWASRVDDRAVRREVLWRAVEAMRARGAEIRTRMAKLSKVAMNHALEALTKQTDPVSAVLERFDMACAEEDSKHARWQWNHEIRVRREVVARYRDAWTASSTPATAHAPKRRTEDDHGSVAEVGGDDETGVG
eukprot:CAMPEP_0171685104 /NCGR_PEP_ID=MMETSP0991-20121206/2066_1 /TAXON_ID=483369 /ORGANISM="non described non described, Strain CCMP2098" /LENGTH=153 /DNA_ID=CAMNT_0012272721 /DNA_START=81 /DNA_END=538 /DNA_ORIENTATION=+